MIKILLIVGSANLITGYLKSVLNTMLNDISSIFQFDELNVINITFLLSFLTASPII